MTLARRLAQFERQTITDALTQHGGDRTKAARALGLSRSGLFSKMRRLEIRHSYATARDYAKKEILNKITRRQRQVWIGIVSSLQIKQIAADLGVKRAAVEYHRTELKRRLGVIDDAGLTRKALELGILR